MIIKTYKRTLLSNGRWDVDHSDRVDVGNGKQIHLATEIEAALPGWQFTVCCSGDEAQIHSDIPLSAGQLVTLDAVVKAHCDNT
jgi:hypothetical protein